MRDEIPAKYPPCYIRQETFVGHSRKFVGQWSGPEGSKAEEEILLDELAAREAKELFTR